MKTSTDVTEKPRLSFDTHEDLVNDIHKVVENFKNRLTAHNCDFVKGYEQGELYVVLNWMASGTGEQFDLLFDAIPNGIEQQAPYGPSSLHVAKLGSDCNVEEFVFVRDSHFIECPEKIVPSSVRLVRAKNRQNVFRDVFGPTLDGV